MIGRVSNVFIAYRLAQLIRRKGPVVSNHARIDMCELFRRMVFIFLLTTMTTMRKTVRS